jgi:hypothetical protein
MRWVTKDINQNRMARGAANNVRTTSGCIKLVNISNYILNDKLIMVQNRLEKIYNFIQLDVLLTVRPVYLTTTIASFEVPA